jgi:hypothetical protein
MVNVEYPIAKQKKVLVGQWYTMVALVDVSDENIWAIEGSTTAVDATEETVPLEFKATGCPAVMEPDEVNVAVPPAVAAVV